MHKKSHTVAVDTTSNPEVQGNHLAELAEKAQRQSAANDCIEVSRLARDLEVLVAVPAMRGQPRKNAADIKGIIIGFYNQALVEGNVQFWLSIIAAIFGFIWIVYTGMDVRSDNIQSWAKPVPGVVVEVVACLFFRPVIAARRRATDLLDRLRKDREMAQAAALASTIPDPKVRNAVKALIALQMAGFKCSARDIQKFLAD
jgi:hypothetical protein